MYVDKPIVKGDDYLGDAEVKNSKFLIPNGVWRHMSTAAERREEALNKAQWYSYQPLEKTLRMKTDIEMMNLRPREADKEIAGRFYLRPFDDSERIADGLARHHRVLMPEQKREVRSKSPRIPYN